MQRARRRVLFALIGALLAATTLVACGGGGGTDQAGGGPRTIEIAALDELRFDPAEVRVEVGETVRFVVTNEGTMAHEFVLGPEHVQEAHEMAATEGTGHGEATEAMAVLEMGEPGDTKEATVTFDEPGEILYACHEPGHYEGGMVGTIVVA